MFKPGSQNDRIVKYMNRYGTITTMDAFIDEGITRLASRIHEIKEAGYDVCSRDVRVMTRSGKYAIVTEYSLCS